MSVDGPTNRIVLDRVLFVTERWMKSDCVVVCFMFSYWLQKSWPLRPLTR